MPRSKNRPDSSKFQYQQVEPALQRFLRLSADDLLFLSRAKEHPASMPPPRHLVAIGLVNDDGTLLYSGMAAVEVANALMQRPDATIQEQAKIGLEILLAARQKTLEHLVQIDSALAQERAHEHNPLVPSFATC